MLMTKDEIFVCVFCAEERETKMDFQEAFESGNNYRTLPSKDSNHHHS